MPPRRLTFNGIRRLASLTDNFYETDVVVECYFPDIPKAIALEEGELHVDIWDGYECLPAIISTLESPWAWRSYNSNECAIICITEAMFCRRGHGILIIRRSQQLLSKNVMFAPRPTNFFEPNLKISSTSITPRHIPIIPLQFFKRETIISPTIRVLVTYKSKLHDTYFKYCRHEESMFVFHLQDEFTEIRGYARGDIAVELYNRLEEGNVYYLQGFRFPYRCPALDYYYNLPSDDYFFLDHTLELFNSTYIEKCTGDDLLPTLDLRFNFVPIHLVGREETQEPIGIVRDVFPLEERRNWFTLETGITIPNRKITITDQSGYILPVILWTYNAMNFEYESGTIVAFRHTIAKSDVLAGVPLYVLTTSTIHVEPDVEECHVLRKWFDGIGGDVHKIYEQRSICDP